MAKEIDFGIPVISIGNIIVGGSGKTPVTIALASKYEDVCVILRGYGRASKGLRVVSLRGKILVDVSESGDEAMLLASRLSKATIIVSENRVTAIKKAKEIGCKVVFLDDGFSKYHIKKFDILLRPKDEPTNIFCLPSGGYREPKSSYVQADIELVDGKDFKRVVTITKDREIKELPSKTIFLTAISKPKRVLEFLPKGIEMISFPDHYDFLEKDINEILLKYKGYAIVTTQKDFVKLKKFNIQNLYIMNLDIEFSQNVDFSSLDRYLKV